MQGTERESLTFIVPCSVLGMEVDMQDEEVKMAPPGPWMGHSSEADKHTNPK